MGRGGTWGNGLNWAMVRRLHGGRILFRFCFRSRFRSVFVPFSFSVYVSVTAFLRSVVWLVLLAFTGSFLVALQLVVCMHITRFVSLSGDHDE